MICVSKIYLSAIKKSRETKSKPKNNLVFKEIRQTPSLQLTYRMPTMEECLRELARRRETTKCEIECGIPFHVLTSSLCQGRSGKEKNYRKVVGYILTHNRNSRIFSHLPYSYKEKVVINNKSRFKSLREVLKEVKEKNLAERRKAEAAYDNLPCI